ncbi:MAG: shikimate kinase [Clostridiales bacterium]|jgi:shikimate kinase|nr:shikimate kinase [Eubacteriales bacterium]MDH7567176.1 shikimate kinase [Clostridiales bacterium]
MKMDKKNIVLVGMPSSGKSTIGRALAEELGLQFIDTDQIIMEKEKRPLRDIVEADGTAAFLRIQEDAVRELNLEGYVIATGGSVICGKTSMAHLKENGLVVYLETDFADIEKRVAPGRRFARNREQSLFDVYREREPLYRAYADVTVECSGKTEEEVVREIKNKMLSTT